MAAMAMARRCCRIEWSQSSKNLTWVRWTGSVSLDAAATEVSGLDAVVGRAQNLEPVPGRGLPSLLTEDRRYNTNKHKVCSRDWEHASVYCVGNAESGDLTFEQGHRNLREAALSDITPPHALA